MHMRQGRAALAVENPDRNRLRVRHRQVDLRPAQRSRQKQHPHAESQGESPRERHAEQIGRWNQSEISKHAEKTRIKGLCNKGTA